MQKTKPTGIIIALILLLATIAVANLVIASTTNGGIQNKIKAAEEKNRPAKIQLTMITDENCRQCVDLAPYVDQITQSGVNITNNKAIKNKQEAQELIKKYEVQKLPALIVEGEINKDSNFKNALSKWGQEKNGSMVLENFTPAYLDLASGEIKGVVEVIFLADESCDECYNLDVHKPILKNLGMANFSTNTYDVNSEQGQELIKKYQINLIPAFVITGDFQEYQNVLKVWPQVGTKEEDALVFKQGVKLMGNYKNIDTDKITIIKEENKDAYTNITPNDFYQLSRQDDTIILDVRSQEEYDEMHLEGAKLIPVDQLSSRLSELNKNKKILVYCRSGNRSKQASEILTKNGFNNVYNLEKGIIEWEKEGLPVVK